MVYKNQFLQGYARDHRPQSDGASTRGQTRFNGLQVPNQQFEEAKAQQKEKFRYRKRGAEDLPGDGDGAGGLADSVPGVLASGRPPAPAVASEEKQPPRARDIAESLFHEWATRPENPVTFNREQKAVVALVVGQVEAIVDFQRAVRRG